MGAYSRSLWHEIEGKPQQEVQALQANLLREQMEYMVARSPLFRQKLATSGVAPEDIRSLDDIVRIPFSEKDDLRVSLESGGLGRHQAASSEDIVQIQASSGTTGRPSYVGLTRNDLAAWCEMQARCFYAAGLVPEDTILHSLSMSRGFTGGLPMLQAAQYMGMCVMPIGAESGVERLLQVANDQRPSAIMGTPNFILYLGKQSERVLGKPAADLGIRTVFSGGEPGASIPAIRAQIEKTWAARCMEMCGGTDGGLGYWAECHRQDGMHFTAHEFLIPEIIDPDTGESLKPEVGVTGELVYTTIQREASPVLRFRSRDRCEVVGTECTCGRTSYKIRIRGRTDDMLIVRGFNVFPAAIKDVVTSMAPLTTGELRIIADFEGSATNDPLMVLVERGFDRRPEDDSEVSDKITEALKKRLSAAFAVKVVPPDSFEKPGAKKVDLVVRGHQ